MMHLFAAPSHSTILSVMDIEIPLNSNLFDQVEPIFEKRKSLFDQISLVVHINLPEPLVLVLGTPSMQTDLGNEIQFLSYD
jgi:hypothetical protein